MTIATFRFTPPHPTVAAGTVDVSVTNEDRARHTFTVTGTPIDLVVDGGASASTTASLAPGDYEFHCRIHSEMTGTLTVGA